jgi:hypothetical protein
VVAVSKRAKYSRFDEYAHILTLIKHGRLSNIQEFFLNHPENSHQLINMTGFKIDDVCTVYKRGATKNIQDLNVIDKGGEGMIMDTSASEDIHDDNKKKKRTRRWNPITFAIYYGQIPIVKSLFDMGEINKRSSLFIDHKNCH